MPDYQKLRDMVTPIASVGAVATPKAASQEIPLRGLLNRHLKTSLAFQLVGSNIWISGAFDRTQNAFVSILEEGKPAKFFDVKELPSKPAQVEIGSAKYKLSVSPDLSDLLESEIVLTNVTDKKDQKRVTLREMLSAVSAAGEETRIGGEPYKVFYYDDIKGGTTRSLAFITTDAKGEFHVFLVPAELIPGDKVAIFKMLGNKAVGLQQAGDKLRLFDNP